MGRKIPDDAFGFYVALGPERSCDAVAQEYSVSRRAVTKAAAREHWADRLTKIEREAHEQLDRRLAEDLAEMRMRHRKLLRAVAGRAAKAITDYPLATGMEGIKAAGIAIKLERMIAGEPTEHTALTAASTTRGEMQRFLKPAHEPDGDDEW